MQNVRLNFDVRLFCCPRARTRQQIKVGKILRMLKCTLNPWECFVPQLPQLNDSKLDKTGKHKNALEMRINAQFCVVDIQNEHFSVLSTIYSKHKRHKSFAVKLFLIHNYNKSLSQFEWSASASRSRLVGKCVCVCVCEHIGVSVRHTLQTFYPRHLFSFTCSYFFLLLRAHSISIFCFVTWLLHGWNDKKKSFSYGGSKVKQEKYACRCFEE